MKKTLNILTILVLTVVMTAAGMFIATENTFAAAKGTVSSLANVSTGIKVSWTKDSTKSGYIIYRKAGTSTKWVKVKKITSKSTVSWIDKSTSNGKQYTYKVCSYKGSNITSNNTFKKTFRMTTPKYEGCTSDYAGKIKVSTNKNSSAKGYEVVCATNSTFTTGKKVTKIEPYYALNNKEVTGLTSGKTYYVKVRSYKLYNGVKYYSGYSDVKKVTVMKAHPVYLAVPNARLYEKSSSNAGVPYIDIIYNEEVILVGTLRSDDAGSWVEVKYNGKTYYAYIKATDPKRFNEEKRTYEPEDLVSTENTDYQNAVLEYAVSYLKESTDYVIGKTGQLVEGKYCFDCSGFVSHVINSQMKDLGIENYSITSNVKNLGNLSGVICTDNTLGEICAEEICSGSLDLELVKPGDILFYNENGTAGDKTVIDHVVLYIGNGEFIHCTKKADGVCVMPVGLGAYSDARFIKAVRILPQPVEE